MDEEVCPCTLSLAVKVTHLVPVSKAEYKSDRSLEKYKARVVAQGYSQVEGFDFEDSFAPTARMTTIWV